MSTAVHPIRCRIRAQQDGVTRVDVYDDIGEGGWFADGVTAKDFAAEVAKANGALEVHINSGGGDVFDGIAIGNAIRGHKGPKKTVVDGIAASIASVIAQAGDEREAMPGSMFMIHDAFGMCTGDAADMEKFARTLDEVSGNIAGIYAARTGKPAEQWRAAMRAETWYTAEEAVAAGLADKVGDGAAELPAGLDVAALAAPRRIAARLRKLPRAMAGKPAKAKAAKARRLDEDGVLELIRGEIHVANAGADESAWDGPAAMSWAANQDDPGGAYKAICAGKRAGNPDEQSTWALPHHKHAGDPPNRNGVNNALARLPQTQGLTNAAAAKAHLQAHQKAMGAGGDGSNAGPRLAWDEGHFMTALRGETR